MNEKKTIASIGDPKPGKARPEKETMIGAEPGPPAIVLPFARVEREMDREAG